ncbi:hypothetical protein [Rhodococcus sp. H29-C3]|uniref:hypothetical protein n=1 Tax=Rhodococcus sp. H29-C3 TaxID=3046307 RepID=UPI0024B887E2|nr:hypothetical protein [Rhodococcus sp. H29-C3]MDJ0363416.1 hypothetical protein [Rhodococcus sp. H29-C3]
MSVSTGVAPQRQGVASALASTAQYLGSAVGLSALVAVSNAGLGADSSADSVVDGLRVAGWVAAAVTLVGAGLAAAIRRLQPAAAVPEEQTKTA